MLDVLAVIQDNWSHKMITAADVGNAQNVSDLEIFIFYDEAHRESCWSKGIIANPPPGYGGLERMPRQIMFNVLHTLL